MRTTLTGLVLIALLITQPLLGLAQQQSLTIDQIVNLLSSGARPETVVQLIEQTGSDFRLSLDAVGNLRKAGVPDLVIDAMMRSRSSKRQQSVQVNSHPTPVQGQGGPTPPSGTAPGAGTAKGATGATPPAQGGTSSNNAASESGPTWPKHTDSRLRKAINFRIGSSLPNGPVQQDQSNQGPCKDSKLRSVSLDYQNGKGSVSRLSRGGKYCFYLFDYNPLYDFAINPQVTSPTGNPFDLLNDAIGILKAMATGAAAAPAEEKKTSEPKTEDQPNPSPLTKCSEDFATELAGVSSEADELQQTLEQMVPRGEDGKLKYVPPSETYAVWAKARAKYIDLESSVKAVQGSLRRAADSTASACERDLLDRDELLAEAEHVILDSYPELRRKIEALSKRLDTPEVPSVVTEIEATDTVDVKVIASYSAAAVETKIFHFEPSFGILSSSAGFLLTRLPARSYSSVTAPNPADPTMTQNVLNVDYGAGVRPALTVLLTANVPQLNRRNFGLGFSAGPVFDISNGKADTSKFGVFAGPSVRIASWMYLTPGIHFGEFADFPRGFDHPGQVIPANTGTPVPTKRYTGRFAFGITFRLKDLGNAIGGDNK